MAKYEMEFVVPVINTDFIYKQRLVDFKRIGLLNITKKIKVVLLIKTGTAPDDIKEGWHENVDVVVNEYSNDFHAFKLCRYYLALKHFDSKWYVSVDDDSVTDVGGLLGVLSQYNFKEDIYISTPYTYREKPESIELKTLKKLRAIRYLKGNWDHDWESHFISRAALMKIVELPVNRTYIYRRSNVIDGFSDQFTAYAAKIAGVPIIPSNFSTPFDAIDRFSLFGGDLYHVHYVADDYDNIEAFNQWERDSR